jgi:hypothetical protein
MANYFYYNRNDPDSAAYNDFTVKMIISQDSTIDSTFTVGWTAAGGTDTLDLIGTVGTGEWGGASQVRKKTGNISIGGAKL